MQPNRQVARPSNRKTFLALSLKRAGISFLSIIQSKQRQLANMSSVMQKSRRSRKSVSVTSEMSDSCSESESQYEMMTHRQEMLDKRRRLDKIKKKRQIVNIGNWLLEENLRYKSFLEKNLHLFQTDSAIRRQTKVNVMVSREVGTRSSDQCRSHHQKMMKYHKTVPNIIEYIAALQNQEESSEGPDCKAEGREEEVIVKEERSTPEEANQLQMIMQSFENHKAEGDEIWNLLQDRIWWDGERI